MRLLRREARWDFVKGECIDDENTTCITHLQLPLSLSHRHCVSMDGARRARNIGGHLFVGSSS